MKLVLITGNHPRHFYVAKELSKSFKETFWIVEKREPFVPKIKKKINYRFKKLNRLHFEKREIAENRLFGNYKNFKLKNLKNKILIDRNKFKKQIFSTLKNTEADILLTYGCSKIPDTVFKNKKIKNYWNIHGGLSPWFKGSITNFWPSYLLIPQFTGITLHKLSSKIDGGDVLLQTSCKLNPSDGLHDLNCRVIINFCKIFNKKSKKISLKKNIKGIKQSSNGKIWMKSDWNEKHLIVIYEKFRDRIISFCIKNDLIKNKPKLIDNL